MDETTDKTLSSKNLIIVFLLFIFSLFIRFTLIGKGPFHPDSLLLIRQAQKTLETGQLQSYLFGYNIPVLLTSFSIWIAEKVGLSNPIAAANFTNVLMGALCIPVFYSFYRRMIDEKSAFLSSLLLSTLPLHWSLSTFAGSQISALFFLFLGLYFLSGQGNNGKASLYSAISFGFLGACRPQELFFMALPISYFYLSKWHSSPEKTRSHNTQSFMNFLIFWGIILLTIFLIPIPFLLGGKTPLDVDTIKNLYHAWPAPNPNDPSLILLMFRFGLILLARNISYLIIFSAILGLVLMWKKNPCFVKFLLLWIFCAFAGYVGLFHKIMISDRYLLLAAPPFLIASAYLFSFLINNRNRFIRMGTLLLFFFILNLFSMKIIPPLSFRHNKDVNLELSQWLARITEDNAIIIAENDENCLNQYGQRKAIREPSTPEEFVRLAEEITQGHPVYVLIPKIKSDPYPEFLRYLQNHYRLKLMGSTISEWWSQGTTNLQIIYQRLYKIESKEY